MLTTGWEDAWETTELLDTRRVRWAGATKPLPKSAVRVKGEPNQYLAIWNRSLEPIFGRAHTEAGGVVVSFPYQGQERTMENEADLMIFDRDRFHQQVVESRVQILTKNPAKQDFFYKWVSWGQAKGEKMDMVRCGKAAPVLFLTGPRCRRRHQAGHLDLTTHTATLSDNKHVLNITDHDLLNNLLVLVRDYTPQHPSLLDLGPLPNHENQWLDLRPNDTLPENCELIKAGGRSIDEGDGNLVNHYVALWHKDELPVFGRCWVGADRKVNASFGVRGREYTGRKVCSFTVLVWDSSLDNRFEYAWIPLEECETGGKGTKGAWKPLLVRNKAPLDVTPCLIPDGFGGERLGFCRPAKGIASVSANGHAFRYAGPLVPTYLVLARKDLND